MNINLKKGLNLELAGGIPTLSSTVAVPTTRYAIVPDDFPGFLPKLEVKEGDTVAAGQPLLRDKNREAVKLVAPAAGVVREVVRGERRKIERVVVDVKGDQSVTFDTHITNRDQALALLCSSGILAAMRQRPYDIVPDPEVTPRDIFVTAIDLAPLSPGLAWRVAGQQTEMETAVAMLKLVTSGKVFISVGDDWNLGSIRGAVMVHVTGKHPAGNVGVQIANIAPVNKGEVVWGMDVVSLARLGRIALTGKTDANTTIALVGSEVKLPGYVETIEGAALEPILKDRLIEVRHLRIISGNVLTGTAVNRDEYLRFPYRMVTVIPEGDNADEFMGWASLSPKKMSVSRSFPGHFLNRVFRPDARILGGRRAMIMSGEYDRMMPMDILPEYLIKAILAKDIDAMEKLGIYEVAPEDFALAEYADTSKLPLQQIVRDGLNYLRKELS
ncbi:MAG: Na(+)-translocating NADH-quinone reductase subunit A [Bacteroidales bacterium]|nr:Na(+)-translocating NADH-quinone reductase subunit A [Bacteroidales bacterium]